MSICTMNGGTAVKLTHIFNLRVKSTVIIVANPTTMARNWTILGFIFFSLSLCMISNTTT